MMGKHAGRLAAVGLFVVGLIYWASPYVAVGRFAAAAQRGDTQTLMERLDVARLRNSFARQIVRAYPADPVLLANLDPLARQAANLVAVTYVDAIIAEHFTPEAILGALGGRELATGPRGDGFRLPDFRGFTGAFDIFMASGFTGPVTFAVDAPAGTRGSYRLGFRFIGGTWRLVSFGLPSEVTAQVIAELKSRAQRRQ